MEKQTSFFPIPHEDFLDDDLPKGYLSPSQVNLYWLCPRAYYYRYILEKKGPPSINMARGSTIHKTVELSLLRKKETGEPMPLPEACDLLSDVFDAETEKVEGLSKADRGYLKDKTKDMFEVYDKKAIPDITPLAVEKKFAITLGKTPVCGIIDLIDEVPGDFEAGDYTLDEMKDPDNPPRVKIVCDLKTTTKLWSAQMLRHHAQFTVYSIAENNYRVRADFLIEAKKATRYESKRTLRTEKDRTQVIDDFQEIRDLIAQGIFPRTDPTSWKCSENYCEHYGYCRG